MDAKLIKRNVESIVLETLQDTPVTIIQGARQVGKSTLAKMVATGIRHKSVTMDSDEILAAASENPFEFVSQFTEGTLIIDEVQKCPVLLNAIKQSVDMDRRPGRFLLTGSADIHNVKGAKESLAGRAETVLLEPFSVGEKMKIKEDFITSLAGGDILSRFNGIKPASRAKYAELIAEGGYPEANKREGKRRSAYFRNYLTRVLDHDAEEMSGLAHLERLSKLYNVLAGETSKIFIKANASRLVGIPESSISGYILLLENLCLLNMLPSWGNNYSRRAISKPKITIPDTGLVCAVNGINSDFIGRIENGNQLGPLLETFVINEIGKQRTWSATDYSIFHYRDRDNKEVDLVVELTNGQIITIEVKAASSFSQKDFAGMKMIRDKVGTRFLCGIVLYTGNEVQPFGDRLFVAPISAIWQ